MQKNFSQNEKIFKISDQIIKFFISPEILGIKSLNFVRNIHKSRNEKVTFNILRRLSLFIYSQFFSFKKINNKKVDTIFLSHFTDVRLKSKVVDNYHGEISKKLKKNFFTLFINHTTINPFVVKRKLYKNQEILPHYLNFFDEIKIKFKVSLKFLKIFFQILFIKHINNKTKILSLIYSRANINSACNGIRIAMLVEKFIFFYNPSNLVITFEGHFYERCIIHILKKKFKNLRIIGNQFTIFRKNQHGLLRNLKLKNFNPDLIISKNFFLLIYLKK